MQEQEHPKSLRIGEARAYVSDTDIQWALDSTSNLPLDQFNTEPQYAKQREILDCLTVGDIMEIQGGRYGEDAKSSAIMLHHNQNLAELRRVFRSNMDQFIKSATQPLQNLRILQTAMVQPPVTAFFNSSTLRALQRINELSSLNANISRLATPPSVDFLEEITANILGAGQLTTIPTPHQPTPRRRIDFSQDDIPDPQPPKLEVHETPTPEEEPHNLALLQALESIRSYVKEMAEHSRNQERRDEIEHIYHLLMFGLALAALLFANVE